MRLHRQSALLNDAIEVLNEHLRTAKGNVPEAWALLNQTEVDFIHEEISNCISSRVYYLQNYHAIAPERGPIQCLYPLLDHQWMVENAIAEERARYGKSQHIVLKPRQAGITEYAIGIMCHATFFTPHAYTMIVAQNPEVAAFDQRKINLAWTELPWWLRPERLYHSKGEYLEFNRKGEIERMQDPGLGSVIVTTHAQRESGTAIGRTVRNLHGTEVSRWESGSVYTGDIEPSMNAPDLLGIMESTARGNSGFFYEMCQEAMEHPDETDWRLVFLPAYRARKFSLPPKPGFALTAAEQAIKARVQQEENFTITDAFFNWRRRRIKSAVRRTGQPYEHYESYPLTPQEAFQSSSWCVFPRHKMDSQGEQNIITPRWQGEITFQGKGARPQIVLEEVKPGTPLPRRETTNRLWIWEQPDPHATYYQFGDVALGTGGDFSAAQIFRAGQGREPDVQVAEWMGWIPPTEFSKILYSLGFFYNTCETAIEYAKEGIATAVHFANELSYPNIYRWRGRLDKIGGGLSNSLHWQTTPTTKKLMVTQMIEALLGDMVVIRSSALLDQMYKFVVKSVDDNDIPISMGGESCNDDLVMAAMGCLTCIYQVYPEFRAILDEHGQSVGSSGQALSRGVKPSGGSLLYGLYDEFTRMCGQTRDLLVAQELAAKNNWVIRPIPVSRANTAYSVIHHGTGMEHELYRNYGMDSWDITPGVVSSYREHGRGAQAGSAQAGSEHDTGYHDTGDMDALAAGDSWGGQG